MSTSIQSKRVMNGTHGSAWIDDEYMAEVIEFKATVTADKAEVLMAGQMSKGQKIIGFTNKGSMKLNKISSYFIQKLSDNMKQGIQTECTVIAKLADPDALGTERIQLTGVVFDELGLADWTNHKTSEETYNFTFTDWDILDSVTPQ